MCQINDETIQSAVNEWVKETKVLNLKPTLEVKSGAKSTISVTQADRKRSNILWSISCGSVGMVVSALVPDLRTIVWESKLLSIF